MSAIALFAAGAAYAGDARPDTVGVTVERTKMRLEVFHVQNGPAEAAADLIRAFLPHGSRVVADARTNKIVLLSTEVGIDYAVRILAATDEPSHVTQAHEPQRRTARRLYDYEIPRVRYDAGPRDVGGTPRRVLLPFERTAGVLIDRDEESVTIARDGADGPLRLMLPKLQTVDGEWRAPGPLVEKVGGVELGSPVVVEWWQGEGVPYLENIAAARSRRPRAETSILGD